MRDKNIRQDKKLHIKLKGKNRFFFYQHSFSYIYSKKKKQFPEEILTQRQIQKPSIDFVKTVIFNQTKHPQPEIVPDRNCLSRLAAKKKSTLIYSRGPASKLHRNTITVKSANDKNAPRRVFRFASICQRRFDGRLSRNTYVCSISTCDTSASFAIVSD